MKEYNFKKGDTIPQFIEKYNTKILIGTFGVDVFIIDYDNCVEVYLLNEIMNGQPVMVFTAINQLLKDDYSSIIGMPTRVFNFPYGDLRNNNKLRGEYIMNKEILKEVIREVIEEIEKRKKQSLQQHGM